MMSESQPSSVTTNGSNGSLKEDWLRKLGKRSMLGTLVGWSSIWRTIRREDDLAHRDALAYHAALHGEGAAVEEDMGDFSGNLVLGDLNVTPKKTGMGKFAKAALLGAALLGTGGLGGLTAWLLTKAPAVEDADTRYEIEAGPGGAR